MSLFFIGLRFSKHHSMCTEATFIHTLHQFGNVIENLKDNCQLKCANLKIRKLISRI